MVDKDVLNSVVESLAALKEIIPHINNNVHDLGRLDVRLQSLETQVTRILQLVYEGTGQQPALIQELYEGKNRFERAAADLAAHRAEDLRFHVDVGLKLANIDEALKTLRQHGEDVKKQRVAVGLGVLGFLGACIGAVVALLNHFVGR